MAVAEARAKTSDLGLRTVSAVAMLAVAGAALWLGSWFWIALVVAIGSGVFWEWRGIVVGFVPSPAMRGLWNSAGLVYVGVAAFVLIFLRNVEPDVAGLLTIVVAVVATDILAYFAGRAIGGPRIAPRISPSKTWAGLAGGIVGASAVLFISDYLRSKCQIGEAELCSLMRPEDYVLIALHGLVLAVTAQAGDFFESWMKRRAGVKDSGTLIPGHGGLFDRFDGLLAVLFVFGGLRLARLVI